MQNNFNKMYYKRKRNYSLVYKIIVLSYFFIHANFNITYSQPSGSSFFVIHCDPKEPYNFPSLIKLVNLANIYQVPLTLEFTIPWLDTIKADIKKINFLKQWQSQGHEIAIHHHGVTAPSYWDGYTNYPVDSILAHHWPPSQLKGTMNDFWIKMAPLGGGTAIVTMGNEDTIDWIPAIKYKTYGSFADDAFSSIEDIKVSGKTVRQVSHTYIGNLQTVNTVIRNYPVLSRNKITGVVHHVWNYVDDTLPTVTWLKFITGKNCKTVTQIMESSSTGIEKTFESDESTENRLSVFPNPAGSNFINIRINIAETEDLKLIIYDILGREIYSKKFLSSKSFFQTGINFDQRLSSGIYFIRLIGKTNNYIKKFIVK